MVSWVAGVAVVVVVGAEVEADGLLDEFLKDRNDMYKRHRL
jgi:hypothetical protein